MTYATPQQLAAYMNPDAVSPQPPQNATVLLRTASGLVADAIVGGIYATDGEGNATDPVIASAIRDATCEQAQAWSLNGIDPRQGTTQTARRVASKSLAGASVSYEAGSGGADYLDALASGTELTEGAWAILRRAGLISNRVVTGGYSRPYDRIVREDWRSGGDADDLPDWS